jgi:flagellar protein FlgJ
MPDPLRIQGENLQTLAAGQARGKSVRAERERADNQNDLQLKKACSDFESLFIYQLFQEMRKTVSKSGLISEGQSGPMVNSMMDMELSKELAEHKGIGLAQVLYSQLKNYAKAAGP